MKKILFSIGVLLLVNNAFAEDAPQLRVNLTGADIKNSNYYLYVTHVGGCVSVYASNHGKTYTMDPGLVEHIILVNGNTMQMYPQAIPKSCAIQVVSKQTFTVTGKIVKTAHSEMQIENLQCSIS
jgi:hypothetical protein